MPPPTGRRSSNTSIPEELRNAALPMVHLQIGEGIVTSSNVLISTVLGSCVSVSFFHPGAGLAGIFHAMLPHERDSREERRTPCKFVDAAIHLVHGQFQRRGLPDKELEIKLFGGAFSMGSGASEAIAELVNVGGRNVQVARQVLAERALTVYREHVGGDRGRKLVFNTATGDVWVKLLGKSEAQAVAKKERVSIPIALGNACPLGN